MTQLTRPERYTQKAQVRRNQCGCCQHRIDTGERVFGRPVLECAKGLKLPKRGWCTGFQLDEGET